MTPALLIRFSMLTGMLVFGGVVYYIRQSDPPAPMPESSQQMLLVMGRVAWAAAIVGCVFIYQATLRAKPARLPMLHVMGWALGESVALFGGVVWFLTGTASWYIPGLTFLVLTFLVFRQRR